MAGGQGQGHVYLDAEKGTGWAFAGEYRQVPGLELSFGKYRLVRQLDDEAIGEAHVAKLVGIDGFEKRVMIRRISASPIHGVDLAAAMISEAKRAALLSHANIAHVLDVGVVDGTCFVATEYVCGRTLEAVLRTTVELPWPSVAYIANEVAGALSYAHSRRGPRGELLGLVHQRLSPGRIVLSSAGDVKVTGFGTSWAWIPPDEYRSPEKARGEPVDGRADVFALGAILSRRLPQAGAPKSLRDALDRAMNPYPEYRPTAAELQQELTRILHTAERRVTPADIAALAVGEAQGALFAAIERIELALDSMTLAASADRPKMLRLYERLGRLCVEARVGERGATRMTRALDLADGLGRDDCAALFCRLRGELLAQANRTDESRDWLERAAAFRG